MEAKNHWETVYATKSPDAVSWYTPHLRTSMAYIERTGLPASAAIIDVGGGESTLVDDLLDTGHPHLTVLDLSAKALDVCRERLGARGHAVTWLADDVLTHPFAPHAYDIWHDRAVFHFLTTTEQRQRYVAQVMHALRPGGFAIVGTFGPDGPQQCSGLPVARYDSEGLHGEFGAPFELVDSGIELHTTPWASEQQFVYCFCRRQG